MQDKTFEITDENGNKIVCDILMTFEDNGNKYMIYTDRELDENNNFEVLAMKYVEEAPDKITIMPIKTDEEWDLVDKKWGESNE